jgi:hypothetical protein
MSQLADFPTAEFPQPHHPRGEFPVRTGGTEKAIAAKAHQPIVKKAVIQAIA